MRIVGSPGNRASAPGFLCVYDREETACERCLVGVAIAVTKLAGLDLQREVKIGSRVEAWPSASTPGRAEDNWSRARIQA
jgi:hypothetical protein